MIILSHAGALLAGLLLGAIVMGLANSAGRGDLYSLLIHKDMLIEQLQERIAMDCCDKFALLLVEAGIGIGTGPCSAQGECYCPPDVDEDVGEGGYEGWV